MQRRSKKAVEELTEAVRKHLQANLFQKYLSYNAASRGKISSGDMIGAMMDDLPFGWFHIALVVPMTSKGTDMSETKQSPLWFNLFASFIESVDWRANRHTLERIRLERKCDPRRFFERLANRGTAATRRALSIAPFVSRTAS